MKKSILKLVGGVLFCLPLMFASCGNIDNPLETMGTGGDEDEPLPTTFANLAAAMEAIEDGAEIEIGYTVYGGEDMYTVKLAYNGTTFVIQDGAEIPELDNYTLDGEMAFDEDGKLIFTLTASATEDWYESQYALTRALTRMGPTLEDFVRKVMVITFDPDPEKNTYDVVNAPGFSFKVLNVKGLPVEIKDANSKTATIDITPRYEEGDHLSFEIYHNGETWKDFAAKYAKLLGDLDGYYKIIYNSGDDKIMYIHLQRYFFIYGEAFKSNWFYINKGNVANLRDEIIEDDGEYTAEEEQA